MRPPLGDTASNTGLDTAPSTGVDTTPSTGVDTPSTGVDTPSTADTAPPPAEPSAERPLSENPRLLVLITGAEDSGVESARARLLDELSGRGFKIVDAERVEALKKQETRVATAGEADPARLAAIGRQAGAEVVVSGKLRSEAEPAMSRFFTGRAYLDLRAYLAATGRYLGARSLRKGGGGSRGAFEPSRMAAVDAAVEDVARQGADALDQMIREAMSARQELSIVVTGVRVEEARRIREVLDSMPGVRSLSQRSFTAGERLELGAEYEGDPLVLGEALHQRSVGSRRLYLLGSENWSLNLEVR